MNGSSVQVIPVSVDCVSIPVFICATVAELLLLRVCAVVDEEDSTT